MTVETPEQIAARHAAEGAAEDAEMVKRHRMHCIGTRLSDIEAKPISWLWRHRIARGKVNMINGDPKLGKSLITADLTARISAGLDWPDGGKAPHGAVLFASAEDDPADTIRPRIEAAGGDVKNVHVITTVPEPTEDGEIIERLFNLKQHCHRLRETIKYLGEVVAVVIDPITAYLGGTDSHKNAEVRELMTPLANLASETGVAIIAVSHLNKGKDQNPLNRVSGSLAFVAASRNTWLVAKDKDDASRRLMLPTGSNLAPDVGGLAYSIVSKQMAVGEVPVLDWEPDPVLIEAADALAPDPPERIERDEAVEWLDHLLTHEGRMKATDIKKLAERNGHAWRTVQRAKNELGIKPKRDRFGKGACYYWELPPTDATKTPYKNRGTHGIHGTHAQPQGLETDHACQEDSHACHETHVCHGSGTGKHGGEYGDDEGEVDL